MKAKNIQELRNLNILETKEKLAKPSLDKILIKKFREDDATYKRLVKRIAPELVKVLGEKLAAELITIAGSLKKLAFMASSKIQILGAEASLFRHLRLGSKPPKHGIIAKHNSVKNSKNKGKASRQLSSKVSIAAKKDYFRKI